jgi:hypothetical protein
VAIFSNSDSKPVNNLADAMVAMLTSATYNFNEIVLTEKIMYDYASTYYFGIFPNKHAFSGNSAGKVDAFHITGPGFKGKVTKFR